MCTQHFASLRAYDFCGRPRACCLSSLLLTVYYFQFLTALATAASELMLWSSDVKYPGKVCGLVSGVHHKLNHFFLFQLNAHNMLNTCICHQITSYMFRSLLHHPQGDHCITCSETTRVGTLIVATIYLQLIQNRYMFRSFTVLQCSHLHCVQPLPAMWKS